MYIKIDLHNLFEKKSYKYKTCMIGISFSSLTTTTTTTTIIIIISPSSSSSSSPIFYKLHIN
jgi:hypothetical protein